MNENRVLEKFRRQKIITIGQLVEWLKCSVITARRRLKKWQSYTSINNNGRYYTLPCYCYLLVVVEVVVVLVIAHIFTCVFTYVCMSLRTCILKRLSRDVRLAQSCSQIQRPSPPSSALVACTVS